MKKRRRDNKNNILMLWGQLFCLLYCKCESDREPGKEHEAEHQVSKCINVTANASLVLL